MRIKVIAFLLAYFSLSYAQLEVGQKAPTFTLLNLEGDRFYLSQVVGQTARPDNRVPVVLSFFQTMCVPCKAEIAELEKLQEEFPTIKIYLVDLKELDGSVAEYVQEYEVKPEMLLDRYGIVGKKYGVVGEDDEVLLPSSYIVAMDGTIYYHHTDFKPGDEAIYREKFAELTQRLEEELATLAEEAAEEEAELEAREEVDTGLEVGQPAPTFSLPRLEGKRFYLSRLVGPDAKPDARRPVVVSFFQTTCVPCKAEIAELEKLQEEFPGIEIYLVDLNETDELVTEYIERFNLKLQMLMDRYGAIGKKYGVVDESSGVAILPNSFIVAPDGTLYYRHTGFKPGDEEVYREKFEELTSR